MFILVYKRPYIPVQMRSSLTTTRVPDTSDTHSTRVRHKWHTSDMSATRVLHERILTLITTRVKTCFHTLIFTVWQVKDYKERNNFILKVRLHVTETKSDPGMKLVLGWKKFCLHVSFIPSWNEMNFILGWNLIWRKTSHWVWKHIIKFIIDMLKHQTITFLGK